MTPEQLEALAQALGFANFAQMQGAFAYMILQMARLQKVGQIATLDVTAQAERAASDAQRQTLTAELAALDEQIRIFGQ